MPSNQNIRPELDVTNPALGFPAKNLPDHKPASIGSLLATISSQVTTLVKGEVELAKAKVASFGAKYGIGAALLITAGVLGLYALGWLFHTAELALSLVLPPWGASLVVLGIILLIIIILSLIGARAVNRASKEQERFHEETRAHLASDVEAVKKGLGR